MLNVFSILLPFHFIELTECDGNKIGSIKLYSLKRLIWELELEERRLQVMNARWKIKVRDIADFTATFNHRLINIFVFIKLSPLSFNIYSFNLYCFVTRSLLNWKFLEISNVIDANKWTRKERNFWDGFRGGERGKKRERILSVIRHIRESATMHFTGLKTGLRNTVSIIVRELSIEWNKKEGEEKKKKSFFASCRLSKRALEREYYVDKLRKQKVTKISPSILNTIEK